VILHPLVSPRGNNHFLLKDGSTWLYRGVRKLMGENLQVVWAEFLTLSWAVSQNVYNSMAIASTAESRVENSAQVSSC
jgi:hypothetical protein